MAKTAVAGKKKSGQKKAKDRTAPTKASLAKANKRSASSSVPETTASPRSTKKARYQTLHLSKPIKHHINLPNVLKLSKITGRTLWKYKGLLAGIIIIYGILNLILVQGLASNTDVGGLKSELTQVFKGNFGGLVSGLTIFVILIGSAGNNSSTTAGAYQVVLVLLVSLAVIWTLRQSLAGTKVRVRDAYYNGIYPLVPFVIILLAIAVQLIPLLIGSTVYSLVTSNGIAVFFVEKVLWAIVFALLALLSIYMVSSSVFALYIVTLPNMTPMKALRSARQLVRHRRWTVFRKILFLPVLLFVVAAIIMMPIILFATVLAEWTFFILTMVAVAVVHTYMYSLYRELLRE